MLILSWLPGCLAGCAGWLAGWLPGWLCWLAGCLDAWLVVLAAWLPGCLAGCAGWLAVHAVGGTRSLLTSAAASHDGECAANSDDQAQILGASDNDPTEFHQLMHMPQSALEHMWWRDVPSDPRSQSGLLRGGHRCPPRQPIFCSAPHHPTTPPPHRPSTLPAAPYQQHPASSTPAPSPHLTTSP